MRSLAASGRSESVAWTLTEGLLHIAYQSVEYSAVK